MKMLFSLLMIPAMLAAQDKTPPASDKKEKPAQTAPTDAQQAKYWKLMARLQGASAAVEAAEKNAMKQKEESQKEAQAVSAEFQKLAEELKAAGCIAQQGKEGLECQHPEKSKK